MPGLGEGKKKREVRKVRLTGPNGSSPRANLGLRTREKVQKMGTDQNPCSSNS